MFIPELVFLDDTFKSNPNDQAELFNIYFYKQFSEASNYDVNADYTNKKEFKIDFSKARVKNLLCYLGNATLYPPTFYPPTLYPPTLYPLY